jgi:hypothetical protein
MKILVTGLSESKYFSDKYDLTIGVNNCPFQVDHLIICDHPKVFDGDRLKVIKDHPAWLFTHITDWQQYRQAELIKLSSVRSDISELNTDRYCHSISSPFIAVIHAYKCGAKEIHLAGVDLIGHPHLGQDHNIKKCQRDFAALSTALKNNGCSVNLIRSTKNGAMLNILDKADGFEFV